MCKGKLINANCANIIVTIVLYDTNLGTYSSVQKCSLTFT